MAGDERWNSAGATERARRVDAARLLGVPVGADPAAVRRAFRLWAAVLHPDQGGSPEAFDRLSAARATLLQPLAEPPIHDVPSRTPSAPTPRPRPPWSDVLRPPGVIGGLVSATFLLLALAAVVVADRPWGLAIAALAATGACVAVSRSFLTGPDHGHVIVTRSVAWAIVVALQLVLATLVGVPLIEGLPMLAVPFVAAIALVNPGAGLRLVNVR
jgi:hypothetical protein